MRSCSTKNPLLPLLLRLVLPLPQHWIALVYVDSKTAVHTIPQYLSKPRELQLEQLVDHAN